MRQSARSIGCLLAILVLLALDRFENYSSVKMQTFETTDRKVARRCRYDQHRDRKTTLTVRGSTLTGLVHSVMEVQFSNPTRWIVKLIDKPRIAA